MEYGKLIKHPKSGDQVVVSAAVDTVVYTINHIERDIAYLKYESGNKMVGGGVMHVACLYQPTKAQLSHNSAYQWEHYGRFQATTA